MKYVKVYDIQFDETFQCEVPDETIPNPVPTGMLVRDTPWPDLPIRSRYQSERHPEIFKD